MSFGRNINPTVPTADSDPNLMGVPADIIPPLDTPPAPAPPPVSAVSESSSPTYTVKTLATAQGSQIQINIALTVDRSWDERTGQQVGRAIQALLLELK